jgi:hypothetical protein
MLRGLLSITLDRDNGSFLREGDFRVIFNQHTFLKPISKKLISGLQ